MTIIGSVFWKVVHIGIPVGYCSVDVIVAVAVGLVTT
jgi:hypothetical protein